MEEKLCWQKLIPNTIYFEVYSLLNWKRSSHHEKRSMLFCCMVVQFVLQFKMKHNHEEGNYGALMGLHD